MTGTNVAARPRIADIDRSNSPTENTMTAAMPRKTSATCEPKMVWNVPEVSSTLGSRIAYTPATISHTPTRAYRLRNPLRPRWWNRPMNPPGALGLVAPCSAGSSPPTPAIG